MAGRGGVFGGGAYSAARAAQLGFARALGPHVVTADSVAPGRIDTDILGGTHEGDRKASPVAGIPVGSNGLVSDSAELITHPCREESGYITGATHDVNGGSRIH